MYKHDTGFPEADAILAISINDEEGLREVLDRMNNWELRQLMQNCSRVEWTIRALLNRREDKYR